MGDSSFASRPKTQADAFATLIDQAQGAPKPGVASKVDQRSVATMSVAELLAAVQRDPHLAAEIVRARPSETPEVIQAALSSGDTATAAALISVLKRDFLNAWGHGDEAALLYRGVLRLHGAHSDELQAMMRTLVEQTTKQSNDALPLDLRPREMRGDALGRDHLLDAAAKDPGLGRLYADFHDRPEDAARQLFEESINDHAAFKRHASALGDLMRASPAAARFFVHAVMKLHGTGSIDVKRWVVAQLDDAIRPEMRMMHQGYNDMVDGGPQVRAERLVPLLAEIVSQPEVARSLVTIGARMGTDLPAPMPSLRSLLEHVLWASWSKDVQVDARNSIHRGAATMFHDALVETDADARLAQSGQTAVFISAAANADQKVGIEATLAESVGQMLKGIAKFLPSTEKKVADVGGSLLVAASPHKHTEWTAAALDVLMRRIYESVNKRPEGPDDDPSVESYDNAYWNWSRGPANQFAILTKENNP